MKKVSVIIPVYNVEIYLKKCIESVLKQSYSNLEILLINDGSTDNSGAICEEFSFKDDRIRVIHQTNKGLSEARNKGLDYSQGDYITFLDSDDYIESDMYEILVENIEKYNCDVAVCASKIIYENIKPIKQKLISEKRIFKNEEIINFLLDEMDNAVWNKMYKSEVIQNIRFKEGKIHGEDLYFNLQVFKNCNSLIYDNRQKHNYLKRKNSITTATFSNKSLDEVYFKDLIYTFISENYPLIEGKVKRLTFVSRLNVCRKIYLCKNKKDFNQLLIEYKNYLKDNFSSVKPFLKRKELIEYILLINISNFYIIVIKFLKRRMR